MSWEPDMKRTIIPIVLVAAACLARCSLSLPSKFSPRDAAVDDGPQDGDGEVTPCPDGTVPCGEICVDLTSDPSNCGACRVSCSPDRTCVEGACACLPGLTDCWGACVNTASDPSNCGTCGTVCPEGLVCNVGTCSSGCSEGLVDCGGACVDLSTDLMNCGACGRSCPTAIGADPVCVESACVLQCRPNRWDLDGEPGCEYECVWSSDSETCDGVDNNCEGLRDEGFPCVRGTMVDCNTTCGSAGRGTCTLDCQSPSGSQCTPPAETCDGRDEDCDTVPDNGFACVLGLGATCTTACGTPGGRACEAPSCTWSPCCADGEVCGNGCDDNCNGAVDEGCSSVPNDTCSSPLDVSGGGRFTGSTTGAVHDSSGWCGASTTGSDVYFSFTLTETSDVFASTFGSSFDTVLYLGSTCGEDDIACSDNYSAGVAQAFVRGTALAAGTYFITVDGKGDSQHGSYVLDVYISPHDDTADACGQVAQLGLTGETGNTCGYDDDESGSCDNPVNMNTPDRVFFLVVSSPGTRNVRFSTCSTGTTYDSLMFLRSVCNDPGSEVACNDDGGAACTGDSTQSMVDATLGPGIYYLFIDAYGNENGECGAYHITTTGM
jgi:hypothetical protein